MQKVALVFGRVTVGTYQIWAIPERPRQSRRFSGRVSACADTAVATKYGRFRSNPGVPALFRTGVGAVPASPPMQKVVLVFQHGNGRHLPNMGDSGATPAVPALFRTRVSAVPASPPMQKVALIFCAVTVAAYLTGAKPSFYGHRAVPGGPGAVPWSGLHHPPLSSSRVRR